MAYIRYGEFVTNIPADKVEETRESIRVALAGNGMATLRFTDATLYVTRGVPVSVHDGDAPA
jgi:hypothetical protein